MALKLLLRRPTVERLEDRTAPAVVLTVNANGNIHAIDPRIYGVAFASTSDLNNLNASTNRFGGNATSQYNWQINAANRASDWYFQSIGSTSPVPGRDGDDFIQAARNAGAEAMLTIPTVGWVAKLGPNRAKLAGYSIAKYGPQTDNDWQWFPDAGNGIQAGTNARITWNDPNDADIPADENFQRGWIQHLVSTWGLSSAGGQKYYFLDNEPSLWAWTHQNVHPLGAGMEEVRNKLISYSAMIKGVDPGAFVMGPEEWGWNGYFMSGLDQLNGNNADRIAHGGADYLPWVLQQLRANDLANNARTLDAFTVHYYPQGSGVSGSGVSQSTQLLRNRSTRALWDPNYVDESWINQRVRLIPRLQEWANQHYFAETPVGITEYNWGAEGHMNGATSQADVWGIFGREGLSIGNRWTTPPSNSPTYLAMKLWRDYDGQDRGFGDVSVQANAPNPDQVSVFASRRSSDGALTVAVINKNLYSSGNPGATTEITVNLNNFAHTGTAQFWRLAAVNPSNQTSASITQQSPVTINKGTFTFNAAMQSVNLFVLMPLTQPAPEVQSLVIGDGTAQRSRIGEITLTFSELVAIGTNAIRVSRIGAGGALTPVAFSLDVSSSTPTQTIARITFGGASTQFGSLLDGRYRVDVNGFLVLDQSGRSMTSDFSSNFHRFFGDINGDANVDIADFGLFSSTYGLTSGQPGFRSAFDYNNDGVIDIADFGQFSIRIFTLLP
jgi:hypothetical protein